MTAGELETLITTALKKKGIIFPDFQYGKEPSGPNKSGVFKIDNKWFVYETDEQGNADIIGPFNDNNIIRACAKVMNMSGCFLEYRFDQDARHTYIRNHFRTIEKIREMCF